VPVTPNLEGAPRTTLVTDIDYRLSVNGALGTVKGFTKDSHEWDTTF